MLNQTLKNRYTVTAQLGRGAMGLVYRATDSQTKQDVAVKVIAREVALEPDLLARFRREGEALRQLRHRNIVAFGEMFDHQGQWVIVMEYVPGGSLHALIQQGPLPVAEAVRITLELCDALAQAHHTDIIHRDIKPENVLLTLDQVPKLTDFGVARLVGERARLTGTGMQIGTPYYMSPEAWEGKPLDAQADIWSLGVMLYEMLAGQVPFYGDTLIAVMNKVLTAPVPNIKALRPDLPKALIRIIERMLARDKAQRYATMRQVAVDLEQVQIELRKAPEDGSRKEDRSRKPAAAARRTLALIGAGALALTCLLAAGGLGTWAAAGKFLAPVSATTATRALAAATAAPGPSSPLPPIPSHTPAPTRTDVPPTTTPSLTLTVPTAVPTLGIGSTQVYTDGMVGQYVPAGVFIMGSTDAQIATALPGCWQCSFSDERPQHTVDLDAFWIDQTDVTNAMFAKFVAATHYQTDAEKAGSGVAFQPGSWATTFGADWQHPRGPASTIVGVAHSPVVQVSWNDATAYCAWAGRRLPTEAQWEKAARGTDGQTYPWGNNSPDQHFLAYNYQVANPTTVDQHPAGASPYGALDMAGNVWQWVADWYSETYYANSPSRNPSGPASGQYRVRRGGSWSDGAEGVRAAHRAWRSPDARIDMLGFRCSGSP
jgi:eukaryotic-like serine/threonine-protein kinase